MIQSTERIMDDINQQIGRIDENYVNLRYGIHDRLKKLEDRIMELEFDTSQSVEDLKRIMINSPTRIRSRWISRISSELSMVN